MSAVRRKPQIYSDTIGNYNYSKPKKTSAKSNSRKSPEKSKNTNKRAKPTRKKRSKTITIIDESQGHKLSFYHIASIIVVFLCGSIITISIGMSTAQKSANARLRNSLSKIQDANVVTQNVINESIDYDEIKKIAIYKLGMAEPKSYQIIPVDLPKQSYVVQDSSAIDKTKNTNIIDKIKVIVDKNN